MKNQRGNSTLAMIGGVIFLAVVLIFGAWALASWKKVPAGNVGVHVYLLGGEKGVDSVQRGVGRHFVGWQQELYLYPTFTQNVQWSATNPNGDYSVNFSDTDGTPINADVGLAFNIDPGKATALFQEYRKGIEEITQEVVRQRVIDALNAEAGKLKVESIYGAGREGLLTRVEERVRAALAPKGIRIEKLSWLNPPRLPAEIAKALNAKIEATQLTLRRENEVAQVIAEAEKAREEARGIADSTLLKAQADAEAIKIRGEALRNNPNLVDLTVAENWDGKLPEQYVGGSSNGSGPILQLLAPQK